MKALWIATACILTTPLMLTAPAEGQETASAQLVNAEGQNVGSVTLTETVEGVLFQVELKGVPPGVRAFHIHEVGACEPPDFQSAGGHFNPDETEHGFLNLEGPHAGDMPNLHVPDSGNLTVEILNTMVTLERGEPDSLFQEEGTALVIHEGADDYRSDPTGEAGGRYACAVIE